ncbi:MAG: tRNA threonylcarbamoyladenosine dehydratase [Clostridia bacterium]|nr:tRNA threonylcarbamoyladenosine dehydratase [Clostridia bacterium]
MDKVEIKKTDNERYARTKMLIGEKALEKILDSHVIIFGLGGVGGGALEAFARAGVGKFTLVDFDSVSESNINRQIIADTSTVGKLKTDAARERIMRINPDAEIITHNLFYCEENASEVDFSGADYIVDAIDSVKSKISIILRAKRENIPIISCMGTGNRVDALGFEITDIYKTSGCPLARVMRHELRKNSVESLKVLCSKSEVYTSPEAEESENSEKRVPASISYVPPVAGFIIAGEVIKNIAEIK